MSGPSRAVLLILGGAVLWGTTGTAQALGPSSASPFAVGTTRLILGGLLLVALAGISGDRRGGVAGRVAGAPTAALTAGAVGVAAYQLSFFAAVDLSGVAVGTTVAIGSAPLFTGLIDAVRTRRTPRSTWWLSTGLGVLGLAALAGGGDAHLLGLLLALGAGASYAVYAIASKVLLDSGLTPVQSMAAVFGGGAVLISPALLIADVSFLRSLSGLAVLVWLGVATVLVAYILFAGGLAHLQAPTVATLSLAEPLTAALLGVLLLGERLSATQTGGAALMVLALAVLARGTARREPAP